MASKKSLVPRAYHNGDQSDSSKTKMKAPRPPLLPPSNTQSNTGNRPPPDNGLLKEDEDAVRRSLLELQTDHEKMKKMLEDTVKEAEGSLAAMKQLMEEREKRLSGRLSVAEHRSEELQQQLEGYEKALIENNIDPVTGEVQEPTEEQSAKVETVKKVTKKDVAKLREKLHGIDEESDKCLIAVQDIMRDIEEVEATSLRAGGPSTSQNLSKEEMQALVKEVEEALKKEELEKKKKKKEKKGVDDDEEEEFEESSSEEDGESDAEYPEKGSEKMEDEGPPTQGNKENPKNKVFITTKS